MADTQELIEVAAEVRQIIRDLAEAPDIVQSARDGVRVAEDRLSRAEAAAYLESAGTVREREAHVTVHVAGLRDDVEVAKAALQYARDKSKSLETRLSGLQTLAGLLKTEMKL